jgi:hypothetical protein
MDRAFEFGQVVVNGGLQDRMISVEVAAQGDRACVQSDPRDAELGAEHRGR